MEEQFKIRLEKLKKLEELGVETYPYDFQRSHTITEIRNKFDQTKADELEKLETSVSIAGRIIAIRKMGKSAFMHMVDEAEKLQLYIRKEMITEVEMDIFKLLDIGDIIGVSGKLFRTHSDELTILLSQLTFLSKCFHPLPEKWHGLQDKELRYRQRYVDLIVNQNTKNIFNLRSRIIQEIRAFFYERDYLEVETPMMQPLAGGASAKPFVTHHNALDIDLYMRIAPELYLKRLMVGGMEKIFEINRNFRNEGISLMHNPEFTMIEFYELYKDFTHYMDLTEKLIERLNQKFLENNKI